MSVVGAWTEVVLSDLEFLWTDDVWKCTDLNFFCTRAGLLWSWSKNDSVNWISNAICGTPLRDKSVTSGVKHRSVIL